MKSTIICIFAVGFSASGAIAGWSYHIQPLEPIPDERIDLAKINDQDQVIGTAVSTNPISITAEIWKNGLVNPIPLPKGSSQYVLGINESGTVVGEVWTAESEYAYIWQGKGVIKLPELPGDDGAEAADINDSGEIVGSLRFDSRAQATVWKNSQPSMLNVGNGNVSSWAAAVNDRGDVVGDFQNAAYQTRAFIDEHGRISELPSLGGVLDTVLGLNQRDQVIGESLVGNQYFGVIWQNSKIQKLPMLPNSFSSLPNGINDAGEVVGTSLGGHPRATLWEDGTPVDLNTLLPAHSGWDISSADAINNRGQIAGMGEFNGVTEPFLMTPVGGNSIPLPSPGVIGAVTFPLAIWMKRRWVRRSA